MEPKRRMSRLVGLTIMLLAACGGEAASSIRSESAENGYLLADATQKCDSVTELTLEKLRPKLAPPGPHAYVLTYKDGRSTPATVTIGAYGEAHCKPGGSASAVPIDSSVVLPVPVSIATEDGVFIGSLDGEVTFRASKLGSGQNPPIQSFSASGEAPRLHGSWTPSFNEQGYDGHSVLLTEAAPGDQTFTGTSMAAFDLSELTFMRSPYSQVGAPIGTLRAKE